MHFLTPALFSPAQCFGYVAFALGTSAFAQKNDRRLKFLNATQCLAYSTQFILLGNLSASASMLISCSRSFLALKTRSPYVAALIVTVSIAIGFVFAKGPAGWVPVFGSIAATLALFLMSGIPMRVVLLMSTLLWLTNNILSGSIGGTMLECTIATINISTIIRMSRVRPQESVTTMGQA